MIEQMTCNGDRVMTVVVEDAVQEDDNIDDVEEDMSIMLLLMMLLFSSMLRLGFLKIYEKLHFPNICFQFLRMNLMFGHKVTSGEVNISSFKKMTFGGHVTLWRGK